MPFMAGSPSVATMSSKTALQKFSYCSLVANRVNFDERCLTRRESCIEPERATRMGRSKR